MQNIEFDEYVGVDWSGAKSPKKSFSISLASCFSGQTDAPSARLEKLSRTDIFDFIKARLSTTSRTLIGIDCNFGYCAEVMRRQFGKDVSYLDLHKAVEQMNLEHPNFFAGNFWSCKPYVNDFWTTGKQPQWFCAKSLRRHTETASIEQGLGIPESPFKLIGAKQVGKGGLAGMRMLRQLKMLYPDTLALWPFDGQKIHDARVVVTEIYPRLFIKKAGFGNQKVRDLPTLNEVLSNFDSGSLKLEAELNDHLSDAIIASAALRWFCQNRHPLSLRMPHEAKKLEGWIFGVE
ncbi:hypothetical protein PN836_015785 [Ningiella sp. W23]|uniref:hypothetical protein n=1 Tax=Ningiella sp. W23 TaxID=3023715 RepID=UPI003757E32F